LKAQQRHPSSRRHQPFTPDVARVIAKKRSSRLFTLRAAVTRLMRHARHHDAMPPPPPRRLLPLSQQQDVCQRLRRNASCRQALMPRQRNRRYAMRYRRIASGSDAAAKMLSTIIFHVAARRFATPPDIAEDSAMPLRSPRWIRRLIRRRRQNMPFMLRPPSRHAAQ
jgi:hypothetical protein